MNFWELFYFNQQDLKKGMAYFLKAPFEHCSPRFEGILKRIQSCTQIEKKELYQEESMKKELRIIFDELSQEHEKIRKKMEVDILKKFRGTLQLNRGEKVNRCPVFIRNPVE